ncbi:transporter suffix domain-containing protein [Desulfosarcina sp.]|uniref:transporter suffix domain-containing protein n=1 Tax=Desulfosarcina sp. TaxID=2027861 RepID=UPI00356879F2
MNSPEPKVEDWRLKLGAVIFGLSILLPIAGVPLVGLFGFSTGMKATITGGLLVSAEIMGLAAVAVMGKSGYAYIKKRALGFLKQYGPPNKVSPLRYKIGLVMFLAPILFGWVSIYTARWIPGFENNSFFYAVGGDLMLLSSLFVLGGDFWDKIRSLFIHDAEVHFPVVSEGGLATGNIS